MIQFQIAIIVSALIRSYPIKLDEVNHKKGPLIDNARIMEHADVIVHAVNSELSDTVVWSVGKDNPSDILHYSISQLCIYRIDQ